MNVILVCDESMYVRHMMVSMLGNLGLRAILASDGEEAMTMIKSLHPDLIISEIDLPEIGGIELFQLARDDITFARLPWIMMSAPGRRQEAFAAGCENFLPKPVKPRVLEQVVYQALGSGAGNHV